MYTVYSWITHSKSFHKEHAIVTYGHGIHVQGIEKDTLNLQKVKKKCL